MRCPSCDMPLSPERSLCPRCGTTNPENTDKKAILSPLRAQWQKVSTGPGGLQKETSSPLNHISTETPLDRESDEQPFNDADVPLLQTEDEQEPVWNNPFIIEARKNWGTEEHYEQAGTFPYRQQARTHFFTPRQGFSIAAACIIVGTLLLVLVFGIARTLPKTDIATATSQQSVQVTQNTPTPMFNPTIALSPSVSPALGGLKYFDKAQIGSEINNNTAQIITQSNTFRINQKIYVTFQVHTGDQLGAACLLWHWGNKSQTHFEFPLQGSTGAAYSYMPAVAGGTGNVAIYYASTTACTDEILAQSISFTVA